MATVKTKSKKLPIVIALLIIVGGYTIFNFNPMDDPLELNRISKENDEIYKKYMKDKKSKEMDFQFFLRYNILETHKKLYDKKQKNQREQELFCYLEAIVNGSYTIECVDYILWYFENVKIGDPSMYYHELLYQYMYSDPVDFNYHMLNAINVITNQYYISESVNHIDQEHIEGILGVYRFIFEVYAINTSDDPIVDILNLSELNPSDEVLDSDFRHINLDYILTIQNNIISFNQHYIPKIEVSIENADEIHIYARRILRDIEYYISHNPDSEDGIIESYEDFKNNVIDGHIDIANQLKNNGFDPNGY